MFWVFFFHSRDIIFFQQDKWYTNKKKRWNCTKSFVAYCFNFSGYDLGRRKQDITFPEELNFSFFILCWLTFLFCNNEKFWIFNRKKFKGFERVNLRHRIFTLHNEKSGMKAVGPRVAWRQIKFLHGNNFFWTPLMWTWHESFQNVTKSVESFMTTSEKTLDEKLQTSSCRKLYESSIHYFSRYPVKKPFLILKILSKLYEHTNLLKQFPSKLLQFLCSFNFSPQKCNIRQINFPAPSASKWYHTNSI